MNQQNYPITVALSSRRENFLFVSKTISWRALVKRCSIVKYTNETLEEYKNAQNRESYEIR
ncbi:MAG: hypothetical protein LBQ68_06075, partial [Clostridiales bacterium]|nr:hypothetical protein [Clostridiales bacterium]